MTLTGVDYIGHDVNLIGAVKRAGHSFAAKYATNVPGGLDKKWYPDEIAAARGVGLDVVMVFETAADRARTGGYNGGRFDATTVYIQWNGLANVPKDFRCYFAVDTPVTTTAQMDAVTEYARGWVSVLGYERSGVYGSYAVVNHIVGERLVKYGWQTSAWSGTMLSSWACLYQHGQVSVAGRGMDKNVQVHGANSPADYGGWYYRGETAPVTAADDVWERVIVNPDSGVHMSAERRLLDMETRLEDVDHKLYDLDNKLDDILNLLNPPSM